MGAGVGLVLAPHLAKIKAEGAGCRGGAGAVHVMCVTSGRCTAMCRCSPKQRDQSGMLAN